MGDNSKTTLNPTKGTKSDDPNRGMCIGFSLLIGLTMPIILGLVSMAQPRQHSHITQVAAGGVNPVDASPTPLALAQQMASGREVFANACSVCHGPNAEGVSRLGKPLRNSAFVQSTDDDAMFTLLAEGRAIDHPLNTTGALMPPRGAVGLNDEQIHDVMAYLRDMQDPSQPVASVEAWDLVGEEGGGQLAIQLDTHPGYQLYISSCAACHGEGAEGVEQLGLPLTTSGFVRGESDDGLVKFIKSGRPMWDANNTTGIDMPPKGGNPAITDEQLQQIVEYLRALQEQALASN